MTDAARRRQAVLDRIAAAAKIARRSPDDVRLIGVSKGQPAKEIAEVIAAGQRDFGENRVQEALVKWPDLRAAHRDVRLHFIGRLQSNKAGEAVRAFDAIHTLDRRSLVDALAKAMAASGKRPQMFVQVNIGEEPQKGGCAIADLPGLLDYARAAGLTIEGLMGVPPLGVQASPYFALLAKLADEHGLPRRSMGMSADLRQAVMLGATDVRVGTDLFETR